MSAETFSCHKISEGIAEGEILISKDDICFYMIDPKTGIVIEKGHHLEGQSISEKILVFPTGKGSSVVQADGLYQLQLKGNAPRAMVIEYPDTVLVASAIVIGIPMVNRVPEDFYLQAKDGDKVVVDAVGQTATVSINN